MHQLPSTRVPSRREMFCVAWRGREPLSHLRGGRSPQGRDQELRHQQGHHSFSAGPSPAGCPGKEAGEGSDRKERRPTTAFSGRRCAPPLIPRPLGRQRGAGFQVAKFRASRGEDRPGTKDSRIAIGQTDSGRYLRVIYVRDPNPDSVFVITAYELHGKPLKAYRRRIGKK